MEQLNKGGEAIYTVYSVDEVKELQLKCSGSRFCEAVPAYMICCPNGKIMFYCAEHASLYGYHFLER
jgi:hypothetical protein